MSVPFFIFKNVHSFKDLGCVIENELHEMSPVERVETIEIPGRSGTLHKTYGDYPAFDYQIENITIPREKLEYARMALRGSGDLILHTDTEKYRKARIIMSNPFLFQNEWGYFYTFSVVFECQPFRYQINEAEIQLKKGMNSFFNNGTEKAKPFFEINSTGGDIIFYGEWGAFTLKNTKAGIVTLDTDLGLVIQDGGFVKTVGKYPFLTPGKNAIQIDGGVTLVKMEQRSVWI